MDRVPPSNAACLLGNAVAFAEFYRRHEDAVLGFMLRRTGSADLAADLTAETFARALAGRDRFDPDLGEASAWLFGIARNVLRRSVSAGQVEDLARHQLEMEPLDLDDAAIARIEALGDQPAVQALADLPAQTRSAVAGRVIDERSYTELAGILRCSESVVRQRVSRGLRTMRDNLEENSA